MRIHFFSNCDMLRIYLFGQNPYKSIYVLESEYISFFAIEDEYYYPVRDMDLGPTCIPNLTVKKEFAGLETQVKVGATLCTKSES